MRPLEVFWSFLRLGLTSFGGPLAHLGYFRKAFVTERKWLDEEAYAALVAQALPGPTSSQVAIGLGYLRGASGEPFWPGLGSPCRPPSSFTWQPWPLRSSFPPLASSKA